MTNESDVHRGGPIVDGRTFDACYYLHSCGRPYQRDAEWLAFFGGIADRIATEIRPRRVLDAGCALGLLVETLRTRGIDAFGIDVSAFAIEHVYEPIKTFCRQGSVSEPLPEQERYDLIVCIEVLEHMSAVDAEKAIANFCAHSDDILFSSSPFDLREATHVNVRPPEYWVGQFARHGYYRDVDFDASFITPWAFRVRHRTDPVHRIVADYERVFSKVVIERNELRVHAVEIQAEISRIRQARDVAETRFTQVRDEAETRDRMTRAELARARATINLMERSWFWRARRAWAWISRRMGRPT